MTTAIVGCKDEFSIPAGMDVADPASFAGLRVDHAEALGVRTYSKGGDCCVPFLRFSQVSWLMANRKSKPGEGAR
jgi:hypothetical protein